MFKILFLLLPALLITASSNAAPRADFFVSPKGDDAWHGSIAQPNRSHSDGPFLTIKRALEAVRLFRSEHSDLKRPVTVLIRGGFYALQRPLKFTAADSGTAESPTIFAAYSKEIPLISGGVRIEDWKVGADGRWDASLPAVRNGTWNFSQLWVNGERRRRPRLPEHGYYTVASAATSSSLSEGKGFDQFGYHPGDMNPRWTNLNHVEILGFQIWTAARFRIASIDDTTHTVRFMGHTASTAGYSGLPVGNRYLIENVKQALSQQGQWYLDNASGELSYLPFANEKLGETMAVAPRLSHLILIEGDPEKGEFVSHIIFRGLHFGYTNWTVPKDGQASPQSDVNLPAAITAVGALYCSFEKCTISHTGAWAVEWGEGCKNNLLNSCSITDMGAGGVKIGEPVIRDNDSLVASANTVENCLIADGGRVQPAGTGIWVGQSYGNKIVHNTICNLYYSGISAGWTWGYGKSLATHNLFRDNLIEKIGQGMLSDMGGIYMLGISPGSEVMHNMIRNVRSLTYGGWGLYFDEGSSDVLAENNVIYDTKSGGFLQHYGENNRVINNIIALNQEAQLIRGLAEDHLSFTLEHNIVYYSQGALLGYNWSGDNFHLDHNLYWNSSGKPITFEKGMTLAQWQRKKGQDLHSIIADPLFENPQKGDFRLQPGSPAKDIGFIPINMNGFGCSLPKAEVEKALNAPPAFPDTEDQR